MRTLERWDQESPEDSRIVALCLERMALAGLANRPFSRLSGGERQRAVIARALAQQGSVLLMDEPNTHLDLAHQLEVYRLARSLAAEGQSVLIICHDLLVSPLMVDRAVVMDRGRITANGLVHEVLDAALLARVFATKARISWGDALKGLRPVWVERAATGCNRMQQETDLTAIRDGHIMLDP